MAYKDEYEVARAYTSSQFKSKIKAQFTGTYKLRFHFAPPLFAAKDPYTGKLIKKEYGQFMLHILRILARLKGLRGTFFDPFGYLAERRQERKLVEDYELVLTEIIDGLTTANVDVAEQIAWLPMQIRGFGHVKERAIKQAKSEEVFLLQDFRKGTVAQQVA